MGLTLGSFLISVFLTSERNGDRCCCGGGEAYINTVTFVKTLHTSAIIGAICSPAMAEVELSFYGGYQTAPSSEISVRNDAIIPNSNFRQEWEGQSFDWPIYAGARATIWTTPSFGYGLDYTHNKTSPSDGILPAGYSALEFTDGLNTWTINAYRRWQGGLGPFTPYVGAGIGLSVPGVEVTYAGSRTFEYQATGPAVAWMAGASYPIDDQWSVFGEYKGTYTSNTVDLDGGGSLKADIFTNALNVGLSFSF